MINLIKTFAIEAHETVNHKYAGQPYSYHLYMVALAANEFLDYIHEDDKDDVLAACWLHDTIEDCRMSYNDIKNISNERVADMVYALSNEKGKTRAERANDKYYEGIRKVRYAAFIKLCDRIANVRHSKKEQSSMFALYKKENINFVVKLFPYGVVSNTYEVLALNVLNALFDTEVNTYNS